MLFLTEVSDFYTLSDKCTKVALSKLYYLDWTLHWKMIFFFYVQPNEVPRIRFQAAVQRNVRIVEGKTLDAAETGSHGNSNRSLKTCFDVLLPNKRQMSLIKLLTNLKFTLYML